MKGITLNELKVKIYEPLGNPKRDAIEREIKMELLREEIKRLRKERKLTQEQLGKMIGVQCAHISKLENNASNVTIGTLIKVLNALNADLNFTVENREKVA